VRVKAGNKGESEGGTRELELRQVGERVREDLRHES
jgi:hypothetical protein